MRPSTRTVRDVSGLSLRARINLIGVAIVLMFMGVLYVLILPQMKQEKLDERAGMLRAVVSGKVSMMAAHEETVRNPTRHHAQGLPVTREASQELLLSRLRNVRFDSNEFFFVLDGNGTVLMHPLRPELEGRNILDEPGPAGERPFRELVIGSQRDGEAVVKHLWQAKYSDVILEPQLTYAYYFWPWDWVVCTSVYVQDIEDAARAALVKTTLYVGLAAAAVTLLLFLFNHFGLARPLKRLLVGIRAIRGGDLDARVPVTGRDELAYISSQFNAMVEDLAASRRTVERSEKRYKDLTELLPDVVYETDADLNLTYLNEAAVAVTGYGRDDLDAGLPLTTLVPEDELTPLRDLVAGRGAAGANQAFLAHPIVRKDGAVLHGENNAVLIRDGDRVRGVRGVLRDVTEKVEMERSLVQSQKMEMIGTLAGGIAHDFNNILGGLIGTVSLMEDTLREEGTITREHLSEDLSAMTAATSRAATMVNQILGLSRRHTLSLETVDLNDVLDAVEVLCRGSFDKVIEPSFASGAPDPALVEADATQLEQILLNLCVNARDAMTIMRPEGEEQGGRLTVHLESLPAGAALRQKLNLDVETPQWSIAVSDEGVGMEPDTLESAFDPFFTTKPKGQGTGLGLAMVYNILQQHDGRIDIDTEPGRGTTVTMTLPALRDAAAPEPAPTERPDVIEGSGLVLVIDDDEHVRSIGERILQRAGYDVLTAEDGATGVATFRDHRERIDLVLLDMVMPRMSGREAFLALRELDPDVRVLMASGFRQDERIQEVLDLGAAGFIQKPFGVAELSRKVGDLLSPPT